VAGNAGLEFQHFGGFAGGTVGLYASDCLARTFVYDDCVARVAWAYVTRTDLTRLLRAIGLGLACFIKSP
jgi:hypothetical protein